VYLVTYKINQNFCVSWPTILKRQSVNVNLAAR
jgi:hypothetical protein